MRHKKGAKGASNVGKSSQSDLTSIRVSEFHMCTTLIVDAMKAAFLANQSEMTSVVSNLVKKGEAHGSIGKQGEV